MNKFLLFTLFLVSAVVAGCGGGGNTLSGPSNGPGAAAEVANIALLSSSPQLLSDTTSLSTVTITAIVTDSNNNAMEGVTVVFSPDSGILQTTQATTDAAGIATAQLSNGPGNVANRTIVVTATATPVVATINIDVVGTSLSVTGPSGLALNDSATYSIVLEDSSGVGVIGETVDVTSGNGNTLDATSLTTLQDGDAEFVLTATQGGADAVTVSALGLTFVKDVVVASDSFLITVPVENTEIPLAPNTQTITATWTNAGVPQVGQQIDFTSTRGILSAPTALTNAQGEASVTVSAANAGPAVFTATINSTGTSTAINAEFIATVPATIEFQADPFTLAATEQSELTAIVKNANGQLVKNQTVSFLIVDDDTSGSIFPATAVTDSQGKATTFYTAGAVSGAPIGVQISASVAGPPVISASVLLTVARQELDLSIGTGNEIFEPTTASFAQEWNIFVTDAVGNAVANKQVQVSLRSRDYYKGYLTVGTVPPSTTEKWIFATGSPFWCPNEDLSPRNGTLDPGEDTNGSGQLEPGNVALVAPVLPGASPTDPCATAGTAGTSADVATNAQGIARVCVFWPQNFSWWLDVHIEAQAAVQGGTEFSAQQVFLLPVLATDITAVQASPPNAESPFGPDLDCAIPPPGLPIVP